jgi:hypothetical protein
LKRRALCHPFSEATSTHASRKRKFGEIAGTPSASALLRGKSFFPKLGAEDKENGTLQRRTIAQLFLEPYTAERPRLGRKRPLSSATALV